MTGDEFDFRDQHDKPISKRQVQNAPPDDPNRPRLINITFGGLLSAGGIIICVFVALSALSSLRIETTATFVCEPGFIESQYLYTCHFGDAPKKGGVYTMRGTITRADALAPVNTGEFVVLSGVICEVNQNTKTAHLRNCKVEFR